MKIRNNKILKVSTVSAAHMLSISSVPFIVVSCSNNNSTQTTQELVDKQFQIFYNSITLEKTSDLYIQNFNFKNVNGTEVTYLSLDEINSFLSIPNLSNAFNYNFIVTKINNSSVSIEMKITLKNVNSEKNILPSNEKLVVKVLENLKSLTNEEIANLENIYNLWNLNGKNYLTINNENSFTNLLPDQYSNVLPSYLNLSNISIKYSDFFIMENLILPNEIDYKIVNELDDFKGEIRSVLKIFNKKTNSIFYPSNFDHKNTITISGFANQKDRNTEINNNYSYLSQTFNIETITNKKSIPFLASGITTIEELRSFVSALNSINTDQKITNLNTTLNSNSWFDISISTTANDLTGLLVVDYTIFDKFTGYKIRPQNITKVGTFYDLMTLEKKLPDGTKDSSILNNVYEAYNRLKRVLLIDYSKEIGFVDNISNDQVLNSTNITTLIPDISINGNYLEFSISNDNINHSKFRFNVNDWINMYRTNIIENYVLGIVSFPIKLEVQIEGDFDAATAGNELKWIKVLPPSGITNNSFNPAVREAYLEIGGFLDYDIKNSSIFYDKFEFDKDIIVRIENESYFKSILESCSQDQSQINSLLKNEIIEVVLSKFKDNFINYQKMSSLLKKFDIKLDLAKNVPVNYNQLTKQFSVSNIAIKLVSNEKEIPYIKSDVETAFPLVNISVINGI